MRHVLDRRPRPALTTAEIARLSVASLLGGSVPPQWKLATPWPLKIVIDNASAADRSGPWHVFRTACPWAPSC